MDSKFKIHTDDELYIPIDKSAYEEQDDDSLLNYKLPGQAKEIGLPEVEEFEYKPTIGDEIRDLVYDIITHPISEAVGWTPAGFAMISPIVYEGWRNIDDAILHFADNPKDIGHLIRGAWQTLKENAAKSKDNFITRGTSR